MLFSKLFNPVVDPPTKETSISFDIRSITKFKMTPPLHDINTLWITEFFFNIFSFEFHIKVFSTNELKKISSHNINHIDLTFKYESFRVRTKTQQLSEIKACSSVTDHRKSIQLSVLLIFFSFGGKFETGFQFCNI